MSDYKEEQEQKKKLEDLAKENEKNKSHWEKIVFGVGALNSMLTGGHDKQSLEELMRIQLAQNQPGVKYQIKESQQEIRNQGTEVKSFGEVNELTQKVFESELEKKFDVLDHLQEVNKENTLPDAYKEWTKDIQTKEQDFKKDSKEQFARELKDTENSFKNQITIVEKYSKPEEKENKTKELEKQCEQDKDKLKNDLINNPALKEIQNEKKAAYEALESTKGLDDKSRNEKIQEQRKEYERQREEARRQMEELKKSR